MSNPAVMFASRPASVQPEPGPTPEPSAWSLTVDPNFSRNNLTTNGKLWYDRSIAYLGHVENQTDNSGSDGVSGVRGYAKQGNLYQLSRPVRDTVQALTQGLRATGDESFYDAIDTIMEDARGALAPGWRDVASESGVEEPGQPVAPGGNGYIEPGQHPDGIWVWTQTPHPIHKGRDVHLLDDSKTFFLVAQVALMYHENGQTLKRDYWLNHLTRWEAAWRSDRWRRKRPKTGPLFNRSDGHVTHAEVVFCAHMHALTGEQRWLDYANTINKRFWVDANRFLEVPSPAGPALVWPRETDGTSGRFANPITYSRYYFSDALELHRLGFAQYASAETMKKFARTITEFILLPGLPTSSGQMATARDNAGGVARGGLPASPISWNGLTVNIVTSWTSMPMFEVFDSTGRLAAWNNAAYSVMGWGDSPKGYGIPLGRLMGSVQG